MFHKLVVPLYRWMVYFMKNPNQKWMMTGGTPMTQETFISGCQGTVGSSASLVPRDTSVTSVRAPAPPR